MLKYHPYLLLDGKCLECRQTNRCQTDRCPGVEADRQMPDKQMPGVEVDRQMHWSGGRQTDALCNRTTSLMMCS